MYYTKLRDFEDIFKEGIPILTYHKIKKFSFRRKLKGINISPNLFAKQMAELYQNNFRTISLSELVEYIKKNEIPKKTFVLTFDDGYKNILQILVVLEKYNFKATIFLVVNFIGKKNLWDKNIGLEQESLLEWKDIKELVKRGFSFGSHTLTHPYLTKISFDEMKKEIILSKKILEEKLNTSINFFCYPYGDFNDKIKEIVRKAGYLGACSIEYGVNNLSTDLFSLKRIMARHRVLKLKTIFGYEKT